MFRSFMTTAPLVAVLLSLSIAHAQQGTKEGAALVPAKLLGLDFAANCDKDVAIYRMRNTGQRWQAKAMITFVDANGSVLFQRAIRMTTSQTMAYRVRQPKQVGVVTAYVDYPGSPRVQQILGAPCP